MNHSYDKFVELNHCVPETDKSGRKSMDCVPETNKSDRKSMDNLIRYCSAYDLSVSRMD